MSKKARIVNQVEKEVTEMAELLVFVIRMGLVQHHMEEVQSMMKMAVMMT